MLIKNARASVATVAVALITGLVVALWAALMPAPAQAQVGDSLRLIRLHVTNIEDAWPDNTDETHIVVDGRDVWNASVKEGQTIDLTGVPAQTLSGINARIDLMEHDTGHWPNDTDHLGSVFAEYTDGTDRTEIIRYNDGWAQYELTYRVERPSPPPPPNTPPTICCLKPVPGSSIGDRTPLIAATVRDAETELSQSNIKLFVDGRAKAFSYNAATDRLSRLSGKLAYGKHTVRIEATDGELNAAKTWSFRVVR